ncbi:ANK repeat-containing protein nipk-1-like [Littorina saxatilis]|uniref:Ankyrin repeat protein n=2 Tax=Littorina saxatilis TaxID=31220 RepID=A0AAN9ALB6_9CAEN
MKMVDTLLGCHHINVDARRTSDRCTPLMTAMMKHVPSHPKDDCLDIIRLMVERDEKPDFTVTDTRSGKTLMMFAVGTKDVRVLDLILQAVEKDEARRLINMTSRVGNSAVHMAAGFRADGHEKDSRVKEQMLRKLIMAGGETNRKNNEGFTPNDWARNMIEKVAKLK